MQTNEIKNQVKSLFQGEKKFEYKEVLEVEQTKHILREWLSALEEDRDLNLSIRGKDFCVPKAALKFGKTVAEWELKGEEYELELELKWKEKDLKLS